MVNIGNNIVYKYINDYLFTYTIDTYIVQFYEVNSCVFLFYLINKNNINKHELFLCPIF